MGLSQTHNCGFGISDLAGVGIRNEAELGVDGGMTRKTIYTE